MSGHSKWAQIKHKKAGTDAKRGALFSKLARTISVAARDGGANPDLNAHLRQAIEYASNAGLPKENIERAISRAESASDIANLKSVEYEAYGPGGIALIIAGLTDNSNRTTNEVKRILADHGGRLADTGSVAWMFDQRVLASFPVDAESPDTIELSLIDAGAEDTVLDEGRIEAIVTPENLGSFLKKAKGVELVPTSTHLIAVPKSRTEPTAEDTETLIKLMEALDEHPDVQEVWTNARES
jgi:YebC/PmpR family DNA-binding regulatory protein